ncbi:hypothetical protein [Micromonospora sp. NPDC126480]|uniref:hypothetical protein n=1 Tax=Micromonospora sp. NPDC126480 TaxID=3155312 RepID=UPI00332B9C4B
MAADGDFLYVGVRLFYPVRPEQPGSPAALTAVTAGVLREYLGQDLDLVVLSTPYPHVRYSATAATPYASTRLRLAAAEWKPSDGTPVDEADGSLLLEFRATDRMFLRDLVDRRDVDYGLSEAFQRKSVHWGTQNWGGLTFRFEDAGRLLYCCDVDVFASGDVAELDGRIFVFAVSVDPTHPNATTSVRWTRTELPAAAPAPTRDQEAQDDVTTVHVGVCLHCGDELTVPRSLYDVSARHGGQAIVPCPQCNRNQLLRVLGDAEARRQGHRFEVIDGPDAQ